MLNDAVARAFAAMARSDVELVCQRYEPDAEVWMMGMEAVGVDHCYRGHDGIRRLYADVDDVFSEWRWIPREILDGGETIAVRTDFTGIGRGGGVSTDIEGGGTVIRLSPGGLASRQDWFVEQDGWEKALEAAGVKPA